MRRSPLVALCLAASLTLTGCLSAEVGAAVREWRAGWEIHKRATVPHPAYGPDGVAQVASQRAALDRHLAATEALCR